MPAGRCDAAWLLYRGFAVSEIRALRQSRMIGYFGAKCTTCFRPMIESRLSTHLLAFPRQYPVLSVSGLRLLGKTSKVLQTCYHRISDQSGYQPTTGQLAQLEQAACTLLDSLPIAQRDSFGIFEVGFYLHNPVTEVGVPEAFQMAIDAAKQRKPYYILFSKQSDATGLYTRFWVDLELPLGGEFSCLNLISPSQGLRSDLEFKYQYQVNTEYTKLGAEPSVYATAINTTLDSLTARIHEIKECCDNQQKGAAECGACVLNEAEMVNFEVTNDVLHIPVYLAKSGDTYNLKFNESSDFFSVNTLKSALNSALGDVKFFISIFPDDCDSLELKYESFVSSQDKSKVYLSVHDFEGGVGLLGVQYRYLNNLVQWDFNKNLICKLNSISSISSELSPEIETELLTAWAQNATQSPMPPQLLYDLAQAFPTGQIGNIFNSTARVVNGKDIVILDKSGDTILVATTENAYIRFQLPIDISFPLTYNQNGSVPVFPPNDIIRFALGNDLPDAIGFTIEASGAFVSGPNFGADFVLFTKGPDANTLWLYLRAGLTIGFGVSLGVSAIYGSNLNPVALSHEGWAGWANAFGYTFSNHSQSYFWMTTKSTIQLAPNFKKKDSEDVLSWDGFTTSLVGVAITKSANLPPLPVAGVEFSWSTSYSFSPWLLWTIF